MIRRFLAVAIAALALAGPAIAATAATPDPTKPDLTKHDLKITTLDGKPFDLAAQRGKWVVVNYWATWCVPCIKEMPDISKFVKDHKNVSAIGLAFEDTDAKDIKAFVAEHPVVYPIAQVDVTDPPKSFEAPKGLPTTYLIAPDGTLAKTFIGPVTVQSLNEAISKGNEMKAARFVVRGKVQGVFFRASARETATALKLTGHARNLLDGSVEVVVYGEAAAIDRLEVWLHDGPDSAEVNELYREDLGAHDAPTEFVIR